MSLKALRTEIQRLSAIAGFEDEALIVLAVVMDDSGPLDLPETVGHLVSHRVEGQHVDMYFPLCKMTSSQAAELALAMILHTRKTEGRTRPGVMDMQPFPPAGAWIVEPVPAGVSVSDHAAALYSQIIEARR